MELDIFICRISSISMFYVELRAAVLNVTNLSSERCLGLSFTYDWVSPILLLSLTSHHVIDLSSLNTGGW